jgi:hypothetical protein
MVSISAAETITGALATLKKLIDETEGLVFHPLPECESSEVPQIPDRLAEIVHDIERLSERVRELNVALLRIGRNEVN